MKLFDLLITVILAAVLAMPAYAATPAAPASFQLSYADAEQAVSLALAEKGAGAKISAVMEGRQPGMALYSSGAPMAINVRGLQFDPKTKRWQASLLFVANGSVVSAQPASGHYDQMIEVPVLKRTVLHSEIIGQQDVELRDFPVGQTRADTVTGISDLIGKSPVRGISQGRPVRESEVESPPIIKKKAVVEMRYTSPGMIITATGEALQDGAAGSVITVRNTASHRVVRAIVADAGTVDVMSPDMTTAEASNAIR